MDRECKICHIAKPLECFATNKEYKDGRIYKCKECVNALQREKYNLNKEKISVERSERRKRNIEVYRKREYASHKKYVEKNREEVRRKYREYMQKYRKEKPSFRIHKYISYVVKYSLEKRCSTHDIFSKLGYTIEDLMSHIENQFKEGMSWDNYGEWHIDHIVPQSWLPFNSLEDENFIKSWCLSNLQPLWAKENISKGNRFAGTKENPIAFLCDLD